MKPKIETIVVQADGATTRFSKGPMVTFIRESKPLQAWRDETKYHQVTPASMIRAFWAVMKLSEWRVKP
jgi:hypothetical protein